MTGPDQIMRETTEAYRRVFSSVDGRKVLTHMLTELHFFDEVLTDKELALSNYARRILYYLGVINADTLEHGILVDALLFKSGGVMRPTDGKKIV